ncbi:UNVERIFIED_CONTAM: hypothetical protein NCL1_33336 [Trichonephila clavipes]
MRQNQNFTSEVRSRNFYFINFCEPKIFIEIVPYLARVKFDSYKHKNFGKPGVTIRVETGVRDDVLPEVIVTLSPMMTIVEALKQAESKFRSILGQPSASDDSVISFSRSTVAECYVIGSFNSVFSDDRGYWKIIVSDRGGQVIYDSVCLPSRTEVAVKPGMTITLLYTPT